MKKQNAKTIEKPKARNVEAEEKKALWYSYIFTGVIGLPLMVVGFIFQSQSLMNAWGTMSRGLAYLIFDGERPVKSEVIEQGEYEEVEDYLQVSLDRIHLLTVGKIGNRFARSVLQAEDGGLRKRIELTDVFEEELRTLGLENSLQSTMDYTVRQIDSGVHKAKLPKHRASKSGNASAKQGAGERGFEKSNNSFKSDLGAGKNGQDGGEHRSESRQKRAKGKVVFAGNRVVEVPGKRSYETFAVVVDSNGRETSFTGVDLAEQFAEGVFEQGDLIEISPLGKVSFTVEQGGKTEHRTKNKFKIVKFN